MRLNFDLDRWLLVGDGGGEEISTVNAKRSSAGVVAIRLRQGGQFVIAEIAGLQIKFVAKDPGEYDDDPLLQTTAFVWNATRLQYEAPVNYVTATLNERFGAQGDPLAITGAEATDLFSATAHGLAAGDPVWFSSLTGGAGITQGEATKYYVIASGLTANAFKVSATLNGSSIDFTTDISAGYVHRDPEDVSTIDLAIEVGVRYSGGDPWVGSENEITLTLRNNYIRDDDGAPTDPATAVALAWLDDNAILHSQAQSLSQASKIQALDNSQFIASALTGGAAGALDSIVTAGGAVTTGRVIMAVVSSVFSLWQLQSGTDAEAAAGGIVRPDDYDGSTNARIWKQLL